MSKESASEKTLISTYLAETEKVLLTELPKEERDDIMAKLKKRWVYLNVRSYFESFLGSYKVRSLEASEVLEVKRYMAEVFKNDQVTLEPDEKNQTLSVTVQTPEGQLEGQFTVEPPEEMPAKVAFVPFLACRSGDPGVAWVFGRTENLSESEARIALNEIEAEFLGHQEGLEAGSEGDAEDLRGLRRARAGQPSEEQGIKAPLQDLRRRHGRGRPRRRGQAGLTGNFKGDRAFLLGVPPLWLYNEV